MSTAGATLAALPDRGVPAYTGATIVGLLVAATAPLWILVPEGYAAAPVLAPFVLVPLATAAAVWRRHPWSPGLALLTALGVLATAATHASGGLGHPDSFFDFFPTASMIVGAALAAAGSAMAILRLRRRVRDRPPAGGERALLWSVAAVLLVLGLTSGVLTSTGQHTVSAVDRFGAEPVTMSSFAFAPAPLRARAGRTLRFVVRNDDLALHTFTIDELGVDVIVKPRSEALVEIPAGEPGTYTLYCRPHTQDGQGMVATFTVD